MTSEPTQNKINREKVLRERNDKKEAFMKNREKQAQRDQLVMPIDDISNELVEEREENEKDKRGTAGKENK